MLCEMYLQLLLILQCAHTKKNYLDISTLQKTYEMENELTDENVRFKRSTFYRYILIGWMRCYGLWLFQIWSLSGGAGI